MTVEAKAKTRSGKATIVEMGKMVVSDRPEERLVTYALGSCLGLCIHDPEARVGGLLHVMLPSSSINPERARSNPARFVDTGVPRLFRSCYELGARKERMVVQVAGGAQIVARDRDDGFKIGRRNFIALKKLLWKNGVFLAAKDVGGGASRTVTLDIATGEVRVKKNGVERALRPSKNHTGRPRTEP